jgi:hypothetical protein
MMVPKLLAWTASTLLLCVSAAPAQDQTKHTMPAIPVQTVLAHIVVAAALPNPLANGLVVLPYRVEGVKILPAYGPAAEAVVPRIGHLHVTVDDGPWHWVDASGEPIVIQGLAPGPHAIRIDLANANHQVLDSGTSQFVIPQR